VILMTDRTFEELWRDAAELPTHFDGVVAGAGAVVSVEGGPARRVALPSQRNALLEVLSQLDIDPHETLGISGTDDPEMLEVLEGWITVGDDRGDFPPVGAGLTALENVLNELRRGWPATSPSRYEIRLDRVGSHARALDVVLPGAHANLPCAPPTLTSATCLCSSLANGRGPGTRP
jgi:hypothetical protein